VDFFYTYTISFAIGIMTGLVSALILKCFVNPCNRAVVAGAGATTTAATAAARAAMVRIVLC